MFKGISYITTKQLLHAATSAATQNIVNNLHHDFPRKKNFVSTPQFRQITAKMAIFSIFVDVINRGSKRLHPRTVAVQLYLHDKQNNSSEYPLLSRYQESYS